MCLSIFQGCSNGYVFLLLATHWVLFHRVGIELTASSYRLSYGKYKKLIIREPQPGGGRMGHQQSIDQAVMILRWAHVLH